MFDLLQTFDLNSVLQTNSGYIYPGDNQQECYSTPPIADGAQFQLVELGSCSLHVNAGT
jgi:hypothetical protein